LKAAAVVDSDGGGDAQSITEALALVREGATIRIHPGRYNEDLTITKSVKLVGDRAAPPILVGSIVSVGKDVTLQSLKLESRHRDGTLRLESGTLRLVDCQVQNNGGVALDRALTPAVAVTGGVLEIEGGVVGPGPDAAIVVSASGRLWIHDDGNVRGNTGYGIYVTGQSEVNISHSQLSGSIAVVAHRRTNLVLTDTALIGTQGKPVVSLWDQTVAEILNNKVEIAAGDQARIPADRNWIWISRSVSHRIEGNVTTKGKRLPEPKSQGAGPDDEVRPNLKRRRAG
jgi:hypothetical protein